MKLAARYREYAEDCRALSALMLSEEERRELLQMAARWEALAGEREQLAQAGPTPAMVH